MGKNIKELDDVLEYHVVAGAAVHSKDLKASQRVKTLMGEQLTVTKSWRGVRINGKAKVTTADVAATNGVVHIIDTVLIPNKIANAALQRRMRERADAMRAARVFKKFDQNNSHYISLCEFENAMYKEEMQDGGNNNEGPVVVHG